MVCYKGNPNWSLRPRSLEGANSTGGNFTNGGNITNEGNLTIGGSLSNSANLTLDEDPHFLDLLYIVLVLTIPYPAKDLSEYFQAACTGTIVAKRLVLTASTCLQTLPDYKDLDPASTTVYQRPNHTWKVSHIFLHPDHKLRTIDLLLMLVEESVGDSFPKFREAPRTFSNYDLKTCVLAGYGNILGKPNIRNFHLLKLNETKAELLACRRTGEHVCIHFEAIMPCTGDMGSALICGDTLEAVYTPRRDPGHTRSNCVSRYGSVFTPLTSISPWLTGVLQSSRQDVKLLNNPWYVLVMAVVVLLATAAIYLGLVQLMHRKYHKNIQEETASSHTNANLPSLSLSQPTSPCPSATTVGNFSYRSTTSREWFRFW